MKKIFLVSSMIVSVASLHAQVQTNSDLKKLINQSFGYFPKIKEAENGISTAQEKLVIAQTNLPTVDGTLSYNFVEPKIILPIQQGGETKDFQFAPVHNMNANVEASYLLYDFGRIKANVEKAKTDLKYAQHNVDYNKSQLANQVAVIYYNIIYFKKGIAIEDSSIAYLNENKRIIESKLKNGDAIRLDLLSVQADIDAGQNRKSALQNNLQKELNLLEYATGVSSSNGSAFDFDIALKDAMSALTDAQTNNLEYVLANDKVQQARTDSASNAARDKPYLALGANAGIKNGYVPVVTEMRFNYAAGISLHIPIYDPLKLKYRKLDQTIIKQNELALASLDNTYTKDIQQALTDVNTNLERIKNSVGETEQAKAAADIATSRYKNGVGTNLEISNANTNVQRAEFRKLQYEYQLCLAKVELARLLGYQYW